MGCCGHVFDDIYLPLNQRLVRFGNEVFSEFNPDYNEVPKIWLFTFYEESDACDECKHMLSEMNNWFEKYGFFSDPMFKVNWVLEDDPKNNMIYKEIGFNKAPIHLFCDSHGNIFNIFNGIPDIEWLDKYILNVIRDEKYDYTKNNNQTS